MISERCISCGTSYSAKMAKEFNHFGFCSFRCIPKKNRIVRRKKGEVTSEDLTAKWTKGIEENKKKYKKFIKKSERKKRRIEQLKRFVESKNEHRSKGNEFLFSPEWRRLRYLALRTYGPRCQLCGRDRSTVVIHVDHIKPRYHFPELALEISNLQILCEDCNLGKGSRFADDWRFNKDQQKQT